MTTERPKIIRCVIYTRKSSEKGLEQDYNSLDAQRECCENYIWSQAGEGWVCLPDRYDDGGYSGGDLNRPAFKRLMADVEAGKIDCIVSYKYERMSRSLRDFLNLMDVLDAKSVRFASATKPVNSTTSAGRLLIHAMLMIAQYERENASERTRDKIAGSRRRGQWSGGRPILGYDANRQTKRLVVNEEEADQVRAIFRLYIEHEALLPVVQELARRGWHNKYWTTSKGKMLGGRTFDKCSLYNLLTNVLYAGRVPHKGQTYPGEHQAIIDEKTFGRVQDLLKRNGRNGGALVRNKHGALLKGLLHCACCNCTMGFTYSCKPGGRQYSYYLCSVAAKRGWSACPAPSVPAGEIEAFVIDRIRGVARDSHLIAETVRQARNEITHGIKELESEQKRRRKDRSSDVAGRLDEIDRELESLRCTLVTEKEVVAALARFDELWAALTPREQERIVRLLVKRIDWDGQAEQVTIAFHQTGLRGLVERAKEHAREEAA